MRVLVTGSNGFLGKNLIAELHNRNITEIFQYDVDTELALLDDYTAQCEFVFHLAGVNRPRHPDEFITGNVDLTKRLVDSLLKNKNKAPILFSSSIQASLNNPYGISKQKSEEMLFRYGKENDVQVYVYRLPNVFGKWCRPNYNSAVATFCYNVARSIPLQVNDEAALLHLVYIDDVIKEFVSAMNGKAFSLGEFCAVNTSYNVLLGDLVKLIQSFPKVRENLIVPDMSDPLTIKLWSTYLSYIPENQLSYALFSHIDQRGSFTEFIKTNGAGQISINVSKPGAIKGNHWHHTKNEKFLIISGEGVMRFRNLGENNITEYLVSGGKTEVIDVPAGYVHNIENTGTTDLIAIIWASECFDMQNPDTFYEVV